MNEYGSLPRARQDGIIRESVGDELLLYDQNSHTAHCLSPIVASVWRCCDGKRDLGELARLAGESEGLVADALHELREKDLLESEPQLLQVSAPSISRREAIGRVARYGAAAAAAPLIVSATAATPAMASSSLWFCKTEASKNTCCLCTGNTCAENVTEQACNACGGKNYVGASCAR